MDARKKKGAATGRWVRIDRRRYRTLSKWAQFDGDNFVTDTRDTLDIENAGVRTVVTIEARKHHYQRSLFKRRSRK